MTHTSTRIDNLLIRQRRSLVMDRLLLVAAAAMTAVNLLAFL